MTPNTAAIATSVVAPEISISQRTLATMRAAAGSSGALSSADGLLLAMTQRRSEELTVTAEDAGERLDRVLAERVTELSRSRHKALILAGRGAIARRAHRALSGQFAEGGRGKALRRGYLALVWGAPERPRGTIDKPIGRHPHAREKMAVRANGRAAVTHWEVLERYPGRDGTPVASLIACRLETGRTHQIRVHLASIGHPLVGDEVYGGGFKTKANQLSDDAKAALEALGRQALHAYLLVVEHPSQGTNLEFRSELPDDLSRLRQSLGAQGAAA